MLHDGLDMFARSKTKTLEVNLIADCGYFIRRYFTELHGRFLLERVLYKHADFLGWSREILVIVRGPT